MRKLLQNFVLLAVVTGTPALAASYHFCVTSDKVIGNIVVRPGGTDFGKEWYRAKTAQAFCQATGSSGCSSADYSNDVCGNEPLTIVKYKLESKGSGSCNFSVRKSGTPTTSNGRSFRRPARSRSQRGWERR
jgi:hypothetical protein